MTLNDRASVLHPEDNLCNRYCQYTLQSRRSVVWGWDKGLRGLAEVECSEGLIVCLQRKQPCGLC